MLDARYVRDNPETIRAAMAARRSSWDVERFLAVDAERRSVIAELETLQARRNAASKEIGALMQAGDRDAAETAKAEVATLKDTIDRLEDSAAAIQAQMDDLLLSAPNLPADDVPIGVDEDDNIEIRRWGTPREFDFEPKAHWDLGPELGIIDFERGVKLAKSRFTLLAREGARLERALINFMLDTQIDRGYEEFWPPVLVNAETMTGTGQLPKFEEDLFKTTEGLYLIPTAEVVLTNIHSGEVLDGADLPKRFTAFTPCFRSEAGSAGRDTRGIIRQHQFDKVELVKLSRPEDSVAEHEAMTADAENILQLLELPYRVISLSTGDLGFGATKTYDIEVWLPSYDDYKEISSCSNCGDFQARRAAIKYRDPAAFKGSRFVHTLNGSGLAVGRCFAAILENHQQADGTIRIPEALRPYMGGIDVIGA